MEVLGQYDSSGEHRPGQRPSSGFVASCFNKVFMQKIQQFLFSAQSAKIRNLSFTVNIFLEHGYDFILAAYRFLE